MKFVEKYKNRAVELLIEILKVGEVYNDFWTFTQLFGANFLYYPDIDSIVTDNANEQTHSENFSLIDGHLKKNDLIETLVSVAVKGKVNISQYYFENKNTVVFENEFNDFINCADEITFFKYVLFRTSNILNFEYKLEDSFTYKLLNKNSNKEGGLEELKALSDKLNKINVIIPESIERIGYGYLLDNTYTNDVCIYHNFSQILDSLYK